MIAWTSLAALGPGAALLTLIRTFGVNEYAFDVQERSLAGSFAMAAVAGVALFGPRRVRTDRRTLAWIVLAGGVLVALSIGWNVLFMAHHHAGGTGHIFRPVFLSSLRAPFYGFPMNPAHPWPLASGVLAALFVGDLCRRPLAARSLRSLVASVFAFQVALSAALALAEAPERLLGAFSDYADFAKYAAPFDGAADLLERWVSAMWLFKGFGNHYPAGLSFVLKAGGAPESIALAKAGFGLLPALTIFPLLGLARELRLDEQAQKTVAVVFGTSASILVFPTLTPTPSLMFPGTMAVWMLVRSLERGELRAGVATGFWMAVFAFFSFAVYMVALPMACFVAGTVAADRSKLRAALLVAGASLVTFVACFSLLEVTTGFDMAACVREGIRLTVVKLFTTPAGFTLRNTGCLLAYLVSVGFPLATLALLGVGRAATGANAPRGIRVFVAAVAVGILLGASTGRTWLETERVWLFYTPLLAVLGGWELRQRLAREGDAAVRGVAAAALCFACAYGLFMRLHF